MFSAFICSAFCFCWTIVVLITNTIEQLRALHCAVVLFSLFLRSSSSYSIYQSSVKELKLNTLTVYIICVECTQQRRTSSRKPLTKSPPCHRPTTSKKAQFCQLKALKQSQVSAVRPYWDRALLMRPDRTRKTHRTWRKIANKWIGLTLCLH